MASRQVEIHVNGLAFIGPHGSAADGHDPLVADIVAAIDRPEDAPDSLAATIDYTQLAALLLDLNAKNSYVTLEGMASDFCNAALQHFPGLSMIEVSVSEAAPVSGAPAANVGIKMRCQRTRHWGMEQR